MNSKNVSRQARSAIHSGVLIPTPMCGSESWALAIASVDENIANEIEQVLANDYDKDEILRNVFRKARQKAKDELSQHLTEFQRKRQVGLGTLYGPEDSVLLRCDADKAQELVVVERLVCGSVRAVAGGAARGCSNGAPGPDAHAALLAALVAAAHCLQARIWRVRRPHTIAAAAGGGRASFLLRDKHYKQRLKQLAKQPMVVRGHHLSLQAMTAASDCHHCDNAIWGLAPQAYVCTDCKLRVHRSCARIVEEPCCIDGSDQPKRISRFMERIQHNANANNTGQDTNEKKSRKSSATSHFLNSEVGPRPHRSLGMPLMHDQFSVERSFRKNEDEQPWEQAVTTNNVQGESQRTRRVLGSYTFVFGSNQCRVLPRSRQFLGTDQRAAPVIASARPHDRYRSVNS
ncbi:Atypical protein kinase C [Eumeta japonica]|uniref:Atypical protein kinase C n=1 Tax=Eumeta variegata TaxID=151549 RepID=A0A4C1UUC1_EUMVA|nr:Atypical protein kinase C [Eumeta japonica]